MELRGEGTETPCTLHGIRYCSLCGNLRYVQVFKGGFVCEECVEALKADRT